MIEIQHQITSVAQVIQLAVAPVFLLAGVGSTLAVLTNRLARIIDRFHFLETVSTEGASATERAKELATRISLSRRAKLIHWSITLCTICNLLVCLVVASLFIGSELRIDLSSTIAAFFIAAMFCLIAGLGCFLREIALGTSVIEGLYSSTAATRAKL